MPQKTTIQVIDRMSNLLDAVARYPEPVSLKVLAAETGLHSSTAFRILNSMVDNGFAERDTYVARTNLPAYTRNTINDLPRLNKEAQQLRTQGYAFDNEEAEIGVGCIGALIYDATGNIVAGLSVSAPIERRQSEWIDNLLQAARQISEELGYRESQSPRRGTVSAAEHQVEYGLQLHTWPTRRYEIGLHLVPPLRGDPVVEEISGITGFIFDVKLGHEGG